MCSDSMKGPKPFGEWVSIYCGKDGSDFILDEREELFFDREHGFFTWMIDPDKKHLLIPKMCGDGRYWRPIIYGMLLWFRDSFGGFESVRFCTKRNPAAYIRLIGGSLCKQEAHGNKTISWIEVTPENTKTKLLERSVE